MGVRQAALCAWETGQRRPQIQYAIRIAQITDGVVALHSWIAECSESEPPPPLSKTGTDDT